MNKKIGVLFLLSFVVCLSFAGSVSAESEHYISVYAGTDQHINFGETIVLQGSGYSQGSWSVDYSWNCSGGTLSDSTIARPAYTAPSMDQNNNQTSYTCTLTVKNNLGETKSDSAIIYINYGNVGNLEVQTKPATYISNGQATLNGYLTGPGAYSTSYVWFQWGTSTSYENQSNQQPISNTDSFSQNLAGLSPNTIYHFRAVARNAGGGLVYGQDMTFTSVGGNILTVTSFPITPKVAGASTAITSISVGVADDLVKDSFFLPLAAALLLAYLYFSGKVYKFADWMKARI